MELKILKYLIFFGYISNKDFLKQQTTSSTLPVSSHSDQESKNLLSILFCSRG